MSAPGQPHNTSFDDDEDYERDASRQDDDDITRDRCVLGCVLGDKCIAADPLHRSDECWTAEEAEAYFASVDEESTRG